MRYRQKIITVIVLLITSVKTMRAQDEALSVLEKIVQGYNSSAGIRFNGSMKMYAKNDPLKLLDRMESSFTVKNGNFSCCIGPVSLLLNDTYYVSVDNNDKLIMMGRRKDLQTVAGMPVLGLDQLKKQVTAQKIKGISVVNNAGAVLQLTDPDGRSGFTSYHIEYIPATGYIKKVILETGNYSNGTGKNMVLEINYTMPVPVLPGKNYFSETDFFSMAGNRLQLATAYKNYQLINQL